MRIRDFFQEPTDQPISDDAKKWQFVGFYQGGLIIFTLGMPLLVMARIIGDLPDPWLRVAGLAVLVLPYCGLIFWKLKKSLISPRTSRFTSTIKKPKGKQERNV